MQSSESKKSATVCALGALTNLTLCLVKLSVGLSTGSLCIYTDAINNLFDFITCIIATVGFYVLSSAANDNYPFGYGRAEDIVSFIMSVIITITGCSFAYSSLERVMYPTPVWFSVKYAVLIGATAAVKLIMALLFRSYENKHPSPVIKNMVLDSTMDFFISLTTVFSFTLSDITGYSIDGFAGLIISIAIIVEGIKILISSVKKLMGKRDVQMCANAESFLLSQPEIENVKNVNNHSYGSFAVITADVLFTDENNDKITETTNRLQNDFSDIYLSKLIISPGGFSDERK